MIQNDGLTVDIGHMKPVVGAILNFFFPGSGNLVFGHKRPLGALWLIGAVGLTYVELSIQEPLPQIYKVMFASVFIMNIAFALDLHRALKERDEG